PPPSKITAPVSPSKARSRLSRSAPTLQTIASDVPSVVVTIGEPRPCWVAHHATPRVGGEVAPIRIAVRSPTRPSGQPTPRPLNTTYVPCVVVYAAAALMIGLRDTSGRASAALMPPMFAWSIRQPLP